MTQYHVPDMSCGHCTAAIEKAMAQADGAARVACDLDSQMVMIETTLDTAVVVAVLQEAGYAAQPA